jgi:hypothetical protein
MNSNFCGMFATIYINTKDKTIQKMFEKIKVTREYAITTYFKIKIIIFVNLSGDNAIKRTIEVYRKYVLVSNKVNLC